MFTGSKWHFNQLFDAVETSRHLPTVADTSRPGVVELDLTLGDAPGIDFVLETNRTTTMVAMRGGVTHLSTDVYLPARNGPFPAMLYRTPYNKVTERTIPAGTATLISTSTIRWTRCPRSVGPT